MLFIVGLVVGALIYYGFRNSHPRTRLIVDVITSLILVGIVALFGIELLTIASLSLFLLDGYLYQDRMKELRQRQVRR